MANHLRYLSTFERFFWLLDQTEPAHFCVAAQVEGSTTIHEWKAAFAALQRRHPFFASSIRTDSAGAPYFHHEAEMRTPLRVVEGNALARMEAEIAKEIDRPFREPDAYLVRAVLLHEKQRCVVILTVHHAIADGISLSYAIRDLLQSLSGQTLIPLLTPLPHEHLLGIPDAGRPADREKKDGRSWKTAPLDPVFSELTTRVKTFCFTPELTCHLRQQARQEKTTVHGAITAAIAFASERLDVGRKQAALHMFSPISTRKMLGQGDDCVLLTTVGTFDIEPRNALDFWGLARDAKAELAPFQEMDRIIADRRQFLETFAQFDTPEETAQVARQIAKANFLISNLGNLHFDSQYSDLRLEALWGPSILVGAFEEQHVIGVATVNGKLTLTYTSHIPVPHLLETVNEILAEACAEQISAK